MTATKDPVSFGNWYLMWPSDLGVTLVTGGGGCNLAGGGGCNLAGIST